MRAFIFPGQGSQAVGMGKALADASPVAREVFQEVDEALGQHLFKLMSEGPEDQLTLTENAQPAIMANAVATLRVLEKEGSVTLAAKAAYVAGHSLGEYSALCAAGAFDLATAARLLKTRGQAMQAAVPVGVGAMAALLGADIDTAQKLADAAAEGEVCTVANDNDPSQVVISGHKGAVERAVAMVKDYGIKRGVLLPVSAPFHCPLMQPAADAPILFFDSGLGGLSVLGPTRALLPTAPIVYVADYAGLPYGEKSNEELAARVPALLGRLPLSCFLIFLSGGLRARKPFGGLRADGDEPVSQQQGRDAVDAVVILDLREKSSVLQLAPVLVHNDALSGSLHFALALGHVKDFHVLDRITGFRDANAFADDPVKIHELPAA